MTKGQDWKFFLGKGALFWGDMQKHLPAEVGSIGGDVQGEKPGHLPGGVQGQAGWGSGQSDLVLDIEVGSPACDRGVGT